MTPMPSPALNAAARLTAMTNPLAGPKPSNSSAAARSITPARTAPATSAFPDLLAQQLGMSDLMGGGSSGSSDPLGALGAYGTQSSSDPLSALLGGGASGASSSALSSALSSPQIAKALADAQRAVQASAATITGGSSATSAASSTKSKNAIAWAKSMTGRQEWDNLCERFVEEAYGTRGVYPTAKDAAKHLVTHKGTSSLRTAPAGAILYFAPDDTNDGAGHAAIYLGNGEMISARPDGIKTERVDTPYNTARYLGWGAPPSRYPGRRAAPTTSSASGATSGSTPLSSRPSLPSAPSSAPTRPATPFTPTLPTPRSAPASVSSRATPSLVPPPPNLRLPQRPASSPR